MGFASISSGRGYMHARRIPSLLFGLSPKRRRARKQRRFSLGHVEPSSKTIRESRHTFLSDDFCCNKARPRVLFPVGNHSIPVSMLKLLFALCATLVFAIPAFAQTQTVEKRVEIDSATGERHVYYVTAEGKSEDITPYTEMIN